MYISLLGRATLMLFLSNPKINVSVSILAKALRSC